MKTLPDLKSCMMCKSDKVKIIYLENGRYKVECSDCGQYLEFNAPSEMAARVMWNQTFRNDFDVDKVVEQLKAAEYNHADYGFDYAIDTDAAIDIVKEGAVKDE